VFINFEKNRPQAVRWTAGRLICRRTLNAEERYGEYGTVRSRGTVKKTKFVVDANDPGKAIEEAIKQAGVASNISPKAGTGPKTLKAPVK